MSPSAPASGAGAKTPARDLVHNLEEVEALDAPATKVAETVRNLIGPGGLKDALSGTWLGHALHPLLTDVVIGSFVAANTLDVLGGDKDGKAAERLIAVGIAAYGPTALTGVTDWADSELGDERVRRVGLVHAATNGTALALYTASLAARRKGSRGKGKLLGLSGAAVLAAGGYLGAHMSFVRDVGPNQTAFDEGPSDWTEAMSADDLPAGEPTHAQVGDTPVMLLRHGDALYALHDRCSHRGCPLSGMGEVEGETIHCKCHGSRFFLADGSIDRGPATSPQPSYEVREREGKIEIRLPQSG